MAETKQEKQTFKWGDSEYLLDDLLKLHAEQEQNFYNFAKAKGSYDDAALTGLRSALTNRINAAKSGKTFSADGLLDTDTVDNTSIQTQKKGLFKKEKYVEQDNTEWAKYYLNKLVGQLKPYQREDTTSSKDWDISKHGFEAYLKGQGLDARDVFEKYDLRDENNPDAARSYTQRDEQLRKHLSNYKTWLENKGFDFTKNDNEWDDNYMSTLDSVINGDWTDRTALAASLRKLGSGNYAIAFTSDKWDLSKSDEELNAENKAAKNAEEAKLKADRLQSMQDELLNDYTKDKGAYYSPVDYSTYTFRDGVSQNFMNYYSDLNAQERANLGTYLGTDNQVWANAWQNLMNSFKTGTTYADANKGILLQRFFEDAPNGFTDLGDGTYLINDSVNDRGQGYIYDPRSGFTQRRHLSEFANQNESIRKAYEEILYKNINDKYGTNYHNRNYISFEKGGIIKSQLGGAVLKPYNVDNQYKEEGAVKGVETKTQKAKNKYIDSDNKSAANPNAGLTTGQAARIGYAAADIASAVSAFFPGAGTVISAATGLGSTFGNFISDWADDAVTVGEMWKNFGMNLGMDALGLIPGGGAANKMGKVVKGLKTIVPTIMALPGVISMLGNSPEIAASWKKAFDGDPENGGSKMTYQDYMNILQVLNVAAAGTNIARNAYKSSKRTTTQVDKIAVDVTEKSGTDAGKHRALVLEGDDAVNFRKAQAEGKAQEFIDSIEGGNNYTINETTKFNRGKFWGKDSEDEFHFFNQNPLGFTSTGKSNTLQVKFDNKTGELYASTGWRGGSDLMDADLVSMSGKQKLSDFKSTQQKRVDNYIKGLRETAQAYASKTAKHKEHLQSTKEAISSTETSLNNTKAQYTAQENIRNKQNQLAADIESQRLGTGRKEAIDAIRDARSDIKRLEEQKAKLKTEQARQKKQEEINTLREIISKKQGYLSDNSRGNLVRAKQSAIEAESKMSDLQIETDKLQRMLDRLNPHKANLEKRIGTHSKAFERLVAFKPITRQFNGADYTFGNSLSESDLISQGLFKQGGSINRNKINKFLSYAKR